MSLRSCVASTLLMLEVVDNQLLKKEEQNDLGLSKTHDMIWDYPIS